MSAGPTDPERARKMFEELFNKYVQEGQDANTAAVKALEAIKQNLLTSSLCSADVQMCKLATGVSPHRRMSRERKSRGAKPHLAPCSAVHLSALRLDAQVYVHPLLSDAESNQVGLRSSREATFSSYTSVLAHSRCWLKGVSLRARAVNLMFLQARSA